jgi:hypothetical protein
MGLPFEITKMITGRGISHNLIDSSADNAWTIYLRITQALAANQPIIFGTDRWTDDKSVFLGFGSKKVIPAKSDHGGLGIAHCYAILGINDANQQRPLDNPDAKPRNIVLQVRDPRIKSGATINMPLETILDSRKVQYVASGG